MMTTRNRLTLQRLLGLFLVIPMIACTPEEELLPGRFITDQIGVANMVSEGGVDYQYQLYFDLSSGQLKAQNKRDVWDLAFSCDQGRPDVMVNSSMLQSVAATGSTDFDQTYDPSNFDFEHERSRNYFRQGLMRKDFDDNNAPQGEVFLINLGRDLQSDRRGHLKLQITAYNNGAYTLRFAELNGNNEQQVNITTDDTYNFQHLSFAKPDELLTLEPAKEEWDLFFGKYMERLWDGEDTVDYSVTGCLLNGYKTEAYYAEALSTDDDVAYGDLTIDDVVDSRFSAASDVIGHDWKNFDLDANAFTVNGKMIFFIKDVNEQVYRFRFIGFYDEEGRKGANAFEYLPLL